MRLFKRKQFFSFLTVTLSIACLLFANSCKDSQVKAKPSKAILIYLKEVNHLSQKNYIDSFTIHYEKALKERDFKQAAFLLEAYGDALDLAYQSNKAYIKTAENFLAKHGNDVSDFQNRVVHYYIGSQYDLLGDSEKSTYHFLKTQISSGGVEDIKLRASGGMFLATHYKLHGKYYEAMNQTLQNIADYEQTNDSINLASSYINLSLIYKNLKVYNEADRCVEKGLQIFTALKDTIGILSSYVNLSIPKSLDLQPKKCLFFATKAKKIVENWSEATDYQKISALYSYANALFVSKKYDSIPFYLNQAKELDQTLGQFKNELLILQSEFDLHNKGLLTDKSSVENAYLVSKANNNVPKIESFANLLAADALQRKDYKKAHEYISEKYAIRDSSWMIDTKNSLVFMDKKFQLEKKEKLIARQQLKIAENNVVILIVSGLSLTGFLVWIILTVRKKRKLAHLEAKRQEQFTFQLLQNTEDERSRIANELHDSVNHNLLTLKNSLVNGKKIELQEVSDIIEEVRNISRNLHPAILETVGLEEAIENLCERLTEVGLFTTCEIEYHKNLSKNKELQLYRIIQEALNNTLKHGKANAAKVHFKCTENHLKIEIKDNGSGFDVNEQLKNPKSFGLQSILQRAKAIMAKININSTEKGTTILIEIPV